MLSILSHASGRAPGRWFRSPVARVGLVAILVLAGFGGLLAAPDGASGLALGRGNYELTASVFGTDFDDLIGEETSSGHRVRPFDRIVALPACTESSCPWLELGADPDGQFGSQTACAESDGLCWVQITSEETGQCAVAPVVDRGPLFVRDDWWNLQRNRVYPLRRGQPAAEAAANGRDFGFGAGISDAGHDVAGVYTYAAAIDLGAGTFVDLGLDPDEGITGVRVKLLWQAGVHHLDACGADYGNGQTIDDVNLRDGPSTDDDVIAVLPPNRRLSITGAMQNGFYLVDVDGMRGWVFAEYLRPDGGSAGDPVGFVTDAVNFRTGPSTADGVIQVVPTGSVVVVTGDERNNFLSATFNGEEGWLSNQYVDLGDGSSSDGGDDDDDDDGGNGGTAETTDYVNFRSGPRTNYSVIRVLAPGTVVLLNGAEQNGFFSVTHNDQGGWVHGDYLMAADGDGDDGGEETMIVLDDLNLRDGPSTADGVILVMPPGAVVTVIGKIDNGFYPVRYRGEEGWAHDKYLE